ncbi:PE-PPE domain-containing protein [[Mycobacterium] crassicus]|uniref:PE-PPE domain-containing protein n=1 Tax=[Mycobacterium] crassicus TaxID=2872309 RepID=A0ABU5XBX2_9MYCO|nr:PE-PPE domain-containing protein [Mycolicibacter sp. MYC098]MEB3019785.1 PE-PPE domain-containing protein [Mycolicibacter sp. MYC098]
MGQLIRHVGDPMRPDAPAGTAGVKAAYRAVAHLAAVGMVVAATGAAISQPVGPLQSVATLLATTGPLSGSVTALILGGTGQPTPSPEYARSAEALYLNALGFNGGSTDSMVCHMDGTDPCSAPLQVLTTPELFQQSNAADALKIVLAVQNEFAANPGAFDADHPLTIFGYSQSATAESMAMTQLAAAGIPTDALHFVFIGNPSAPNGVWQHLEAAMDATLGTKFTDFVLSFTGMDTSIGSSTPNDLYPTTIYSLPDDPVANFVDSYAANGLWGALLNIFGPHVEYLGLTPEQIADATITVDGMLTYVDINDADINGFDAWLSALLEHGVANSDPLQSVWDSLVLLFTNSY